MNSTYSKSVGVAVLPVLFGTYARAQEPDRQWLGELSLESSIGETGPVVLGLPALLTAGPEAGFAIADFGDHTVRRFDKDSRERWVFGRKGAGPGEFGGFSSLIFDSDGKLAILDPELQRVTLIDREGTLVSTTRIPIPTRRLLPSHVPEGDWVLAAYDNEHLWVKVSRDGRREGGSILPAELRVEHALLSEPFTARSDRGAIIAYRWSSRLVFLDNEGSVRDIIDGVEEVDLPTLSDGHPAVTRVDPEATPAALDVSAALGKVFVLFAGAEVVDSRIVDVYDEESRSYIGSYRVPSTVIDIAALADGRLATLERDLIPVVRIWSLGWAEAAIRPSLSAERRR